MQAFKEGKQPRVLSSHVAYQQPAQYNNLPNGTAVTAYLGPKSAAVTIYLGPKGAAVTVYLGSNQQLFLVLKTCSTRWESCLVLTRNPVKYPGQVNSWILKGTYIHQLTNSIILNSSPNVCPYTQRQAQSSLSSRKILFQQKQTMQKTTTN